MYYILEENIFELNWKLYFRLICSTCIRRPIRIWFKSVSIWENIIWASNGTSWKCRPSATKNITAAAVTHRFPIFFSTSRWDVKLCSTRWIWSFRVLAFHVSPYWCFTCRPIPARKCHCACRFYSHWPCSSYCWPKLSRRHHWRCPYWVNISYLPWSWWRCPSWWPSLCSTSTSDRLPHTGWHLGSNGSS